MKSGSTTAERLVISFLGMPGFLCGRPWMMTPVQIFMVLKTSLLFLFASELLGGILAKSAWGQCPCHWTIAFHPERRKWTSKGQKRSHEDCGVCQLVAWQLVVVYIYKQKGLEVWLQILATHRPTTTAHWQHVPSVAGPHKAIPTTVSHTFDKHATLGKLIV